MQPWSSIYDDVIDSEDDDQEDHVEIIQDEDIEVGNEVEVMAKGGNLKEIEEEDVDVDVEDGVQFLGCFEGKKKKEGIEGMNEIDVMTDIDGEEEYLKEFIMDQEESFHDEEKEVEIGEQYFGVINQEESPSSFKKQEILAQPTPMPPSSENGVENVPESNNDFNFNIEGLDIEMIIPEKDDDDDDDQVEKEEDDDYPVQSDDQDEEEDEEYEYSGHPPGPHYRCPFQDKESFEEDEHSHYPDDADGNDGFTDNYQNDVETDDSAPDGQGPEKEMVGLSWLHNSTALMKSDKEAIAYVQGLPKESRKRMDLRHPKFVGLKNAHLIGKLIGNGKIVNPPEEDVFPFIDSEQEIVLAENGVRVLSEQRNYATDDGNDVFVTKDQNKVLFLGGGLPLEPVLTNPSWNQVVDNFRRELAYRRDNSNYPVKLQFDSGFPSGSGSAESSVKGSQENEPQLLEMDDESDIIHDTISAWIVIDNPENGLGVSSSDTEKIQKQGPQPHTDGWIYPKPGLSYSCLITLSLKNSTNGYLPVTDIYKFMCDHFPYFRTAPKGWKNSVRHNLSLRDCFEKIDTIETMGARKRCLWSIYPGRKLHMQEELYKWSRKNHLSITIAMANPESLELLLRGEMKKDYSETNFDPVSSFQGSISPSEYSRSSVGVLGPGFDIVERKIMQLDRQTVSFEEFEFM